MKKTYISAQGKKIDIDGLRVANEHVIAVGNMKVNARGDELGPGGQVAQTRNQSMETYYKLNTPVPSNNAVPDKVINQTRAAGVTIASGVATSSDAPFESADSQEPITDSVPEETTEPTPVAQPTMRGSLAASVADPKTVNQELLKPLSKRNGISRI